MDESNKLLSFYNQQISLKQGKLREINIRLGIATPNKELKLVGSNGDEQQIQIEATSFKFGIESIEEDDQEDMSQFIGDRTHKEDRFYNVSPKKKLLWRLKHK